VYFTKVIPAGPPGPADTRPISQPHVRCRLKLNACQLSASEPGFIE